ncbi:hypothetical protein AAY473_034595 [Plecturocebus cupreus]
MGAGLGEERQRVEDERGQGQETRFTMLTIAGLELLTSGDSPAMASQSAGITEYKLHSARGFGYESESGFTHPEHPKAKVTLWSLRLALSIFKPSKTMSDPSCPSRLSDIPFCSETESRSIPGWSAGPTRLTATPFLVSSISCLASEREPPRPAENSAFKGLAVVQIYCEIWLQPMEIRHSSKDNSKWDELQKAKPAAPLTNFHGPDIPVEEPYGCRVTLAARLFCASAQRLLVRRARLSLLLDDVALGKSGVHQL